MKYLYLVRIIVKKSNPKIIHRACFEVKYVAQKLM